MEEIGLWLKCDPSIKIQEKISGTRIFGRIRIINLTQKGKENGWYDRGEETILRNIDDGWKSPQMLQLCLVLERISVEKPEQKEESSIVI